jgi:ribosome maturation factor RimP
MFRKTLGVAVFLGLTMGLAYADEIRGKVKNVDGDKNTITVTVPDKDATKDVTYSVGKDVKIYTLVKGKKKNDPSTEVPVALSAVKTDAGVTITTEKKDKQDVVTAIKIDAEMKKKKKNQ